MACFNRNRNDLIDIMSKINRILLAPFHGRTDYKLHYLGCFFLTVWGIVLTSLLPEWVGTIPVWIVAILVIAFALLKESVLDSTFSLPDLLYSIGGVLTGLIFVMI